MSFLKKLFSPKETPVKTNEEFWNWFKDNEKTFHHVIKSNGNIVNVFFKRLEPKLNELREGYYYLTGMCDENTAELVLTADGVIKNIYFVEELVKSAPDVQGWKFTALKPALNGTDVNIGMGNYKFELGNLHFYANEIDGCPDEIDITIVHDDMNQSNKMEILNGTYIFLDNLLGELNFACTVDNLSVVEKKDATREMIPISKLKDYLLWREKEFIEKYEGTWHDNDNDKHAVFQAEDEKGYGVIAVMNTELLNWDGKASHPWRLNISLNYDGRKNNGMPDDETNEWLEAVENELNHSLKWNAGYLNIGRQTSYNNREIYFACKEFRLPSKVLDQISRKQYGNLSIDFNIFKDKYWRSLEHFISLK